MRINDSHINTCKIDAKEFALQWFTPTMEIKLCGHATLAAAHVLSVELGEINYKILCYKLDN